MARPPQRLQRGGTVRGCRLQVKRHQETNRKLRACAQIV
jgi:hypothetical protein